jgi:hypothetical protein
MDVALTDEEREVVVWALRRFRHQLARLADQPALDERELLLGMDVSGIAENLIARLGP